MIFLENLSCKTILIWPIPRVTIFLPFYQTERHRKAKCLDDDLSRQRKLISGVGIVLDEPFPHSIFRYLVLPVLKTMLPVCTFQSALTNALFSQRRVNHKFRRSLHPLQSLTSLRQFDLIFPPPC
jgi:hypothetical protein